MENTKRSNKSKFAYILKIKTSYYDSQNILLDIEDMFKNPSRFKISKDDLYQTLANGFLSRELNSSGDVYAKIFDLIKN